MASASDRTMFEIYREADYGRRYRVVFFTELDEHNKEAEINRAMMGEHFFDGFLEDRSKEAGKRVLAGVVERLNRSEAVRPEEIEQALAAIE